MARHPKKVALAYSGGLDTSIIIPSLRAHYRPEVVAAYRLYFRAVILPQPSNADRIVEPA